MAVIASFSVAHEMDNASKLADPENLYKPGSRKLKKKN